MRTSLLITFLFTLLAASTYAADSPAKPLVANSGFEVDADGDKWPDQWTKQKQGVTWEQEGENHFLRLVSSKPGEMVMVYHQVRLPADVRAVTLSWKQRISNLKPGKQPWFDARLLLEFKDAEGNKLAGSPSAPYARKNTDGWVDRSTSFLVPEGAHLLEFMPSLFQVEAGMLDLDDVTLVAADPAPLQEAAKAAAAAAKEKQEKNAAGRRAKAAAVLEKEGSIIANGSFQTDAKVGGVPDQWGKGKPGGDWEVENSNRFLRLKSLEKGKTVMLYREIDIPAGVEAIEFTWRQRITDLKPGKESYFDARIMMEFKDAAGKKIGKPSPPYARSNTEGWVEKKVQFLVPPAALSLEFMPSLFQVERGTYDLDDLKMKPVPAAELLAAAAAAAAMEKAAQVPAEEPNKAKWPLETHVEGNKIVDSQGKHVWLQGVNVVSLEFSIKGEKVMKSALVAVDEWKSNCIRLPVKEEYWYGRAAGQKDGGKSYRELVDQVITLVANRGAYVALDLHRFRAPNDLHVEFWKDAATVYKNHPAVLFDLFNEPHGISWEVWQKGGFVEEKKKPADEDNFLTPEEKAKAKNGFESPGMQKLIDTVRATGARNIVICGGLDWAYDLSGIANGHELSDTSGNGIVYSTHIYPWKRDWENKVMKVAAKHPIFIGEVGADINKMSFIPAEAQEDPYTWVPDMLGLIQKHKLNWTGFSFHPKATPILISDWNFTPTPFWGKFAKDALSGKQFELKKQR
ncbi:Endoglucanase 5 precursor [Anatilimnocola aggregata]|uniref:Endoglucanase 5 n=1 Tax=Anatilimnocola aggregata TaxID=2528021 RepID=A0A517YCH3_9BACT|nr:cellulase family glycosylhydrolase [Anatilimnocola aggregata]QDU27947.1 Endoglucanase 5 precursor [Anatilimnocola aggregata]